MRRIAIGIRIRQRGGRQLAETEKDYMKLIGLEEETRRRLSYERALDMY